MAELADELNFEVDDLLPLVDAAVLLDLARTEGPRLALTPAGREFAAADILTSKQLFARHAVAHAPLVRAIVQALTTAGDHVLREGLFLDLLHRGFSDEDARRQLDTAIDWGRYGELFAYDKAEGGWSWNPSRSGCGSGAARRARSDRLGSRADQTRWRTPVTRPR